jgi:hypothetical protein
VRSETCGGGEAGKVRIRIRIRRIGSEEEDRVGM